MTYQTPTMAPFCKDEEKYQVVEDLIKQYNSNEWNRLIMIINNTFSNLSYDRFPLNNPHFPILQEYSKQIKYIKRDAENTKF